MNDQLRQHQRSPKCMLRTLHLLCDDSSRLIAGILCRNNFSSNCVASDMLGEFRSHLQPCYGDGALVYVSLNST